MTTTTMSQISGISHGTVCAAICDVKRASVWRPSGPRASQAAAGAAGNHTAGKHGSGANVVCRVVLTTGRRQPDEPACVRVGEAPVRTSTYDCTGRPLRPRALRCHGRAGRRVGKLLRERGGAAAEHGAPPPNPDARGCAALADARPRCAAQGLARSVALFAGSVVLMRQFGDLMAI